jgi:hypothetical protein
MNDVAWRVMSRKFAWQPLSISARRSKLQSSLRSATHSEPLPYGCVPRSATHRNGKHVFPRRCILIEDGRLVALDGGHSFEHFDRAVGGSGKDLLRKVGIDFASTSASLCSDSGCIRRSVALECRDVYGVAESRRPARLSALTIADAGSVLQSRSLSLPSRTPPSYLGAFSAHHVQHVERISLPRTDWAECFSASTDPI